MTTLRDLLERVLDDPSAARDLDELPEAEQLLLHLAALGRADALAGLRDSLVAALDDEAGADLLAQLTSFADAEQLEGVLAERPISSERLAAAADGADGTSPWPARYEGSGWLVTVAVEERGRLYVAVDGLPAGVTGAGRVVLVAADPIEMPLRSGSHAVIGPAVEVLGGPAEFNPWSELTVEFDGGAVALALREDAP